MSGNVLVKNLKFKKNINIVPTSRSKQSSREDKHKETTGMQFRKFNDVNLLIN